MRVSEEFVLAVVVVVPVVAGVVAVVVPAVMLFEIESQSTFEGTDRGNPKHVQLLKGLTKKLSLLVSYTFHHW